MSAKHKCPALVGDGWARFLCGKGATHEHEGRFFCKTHHPPTVKAKADARRKAWVDEWSRKLEAQKEAAAAMAEQKRRADLFPELLSALLAAVEEVDGTFPFAFLESARAAIAKAIGEQP